MATILRGKEVADALNQGSLQDIERLRSQNINPTLALIRLGNRQDDVAYESSIIKKATSMGIRTIPCTLEETIGQQELEAQIDRFNADAGVHGILVFRPLPAHIDEQAALNRIAPEKDVDGVSEVSMGRIFAGDSDGFGPCTAESVMAILRHYGISLVGKKAVVLGRSLVIGKPVSIMLLGQNATVTICHSKTQSLSEVCKEADILVAALGKPKFVSAAYVSKDQVVIDVGIHVDAEGNMCGDVDFDEVSPIVNAITPVPGGVGTVTTAILMKHVITSALKRDKIG